MKRMRSHKLSRWLARLLTVAIAVPAAILGGPARPARAQQPRAPLVYVLDFNNKSEIGGALLGRQAAAQMAIEMNNSGQWNVIPDRTVQAAIQNLGFKPPFDRVARQMIAREIDAELVVYGSVEAAMVETDPMEARTRIRVVVEDVRTGVLFNGAIADGDSMPRMGYRGEADILLDEALAKAAFVARTTLARFRPPEGTVLNTAVVRDVRTIALINIGTRQGVKRDMEMVVTRRGELVGFLKIVSLYSDSSNALITLNLQGVAPEDRVRSIFDFETFPNAIGKLRREQNDASGKADAGDKPAKVAKKAEKPVRQAKASKSRKAAPLALALASERNGNFTPMVAAEQDKGEPLIGGNIDEGAIDSETVTVDEPEAARGRKKSALAGPLGKILVGGALLAGILAVAGTKSETRAFDVENVLVQAGGCGGPTGLRVRWNRPRGVPSTGTVPFDTGGGGGGTGGNTNAKQGILGYLVWRTDTTGGAIQEVVGTNLGDLREFLDQATAAHTMAAEFGGEPTPGVAVTAPTVPGTTVVPGLIPGNRYRYQIMTAYRTLQSFSGQPVQVIQNLFSPFSPYSNPTTYIEPRAVLFPTNGAPVDLTNFTAEWETTPGADRYQVIISRDIRFLPNQTVRLPIVTVVPPNLGGPLTAAIGPVAVNNPKLAGANQIFISVLAWNSSDPVLPRPLGGVCYAPVQATNATPPPPAP